MGGMSEMMYQKKTYVFFSYVSHSSVAIIWGIPRQTLNIKSVGETLHAYGRLSPLRTDDFPKVYSGPRKM
jgi:hypothetical protein